MAIPLQRIKDLALRLARVARRWNGLLTLFALVSAFILTIVGSLWGVFLALCVVALLQLHHSALIEIGFERQNDIEARQAAAPTYTPSSTSAASLEAPHGGLPDAVEKLLGTSNQLLDTVTVIVPLYNEARFIADCLESIRRQTWRNWECIVVDDASSDSSTEEVARFVAQDSRFRLVRHQVNSGLSASRNTGLRLARSAYVTFLDADDMLLKHGLQMRMSMLRAIQGEASLAGVYCGIVQVPEETTLDYMPANLKFQQTTADFVNTQAECPFNAHAPILRTDILRSLGGFDESMRDGAEDWDLWQRVMRSGYYFRSVPKVGALYRRKRQSMVRTKSAHHLLEAKRLYEKAAAEFRPDAFAMTTRVFDLPASRYAQTLSFIRRLVPFAAMAYVQSGDEGLEGALNELPEEAGTYLLRHINTEALASVGILRAFAVDEAGKQEMQAEHDAVTSHIVSRIEARLQELDQQHEVAPIPAPAYTIVFYVTDGYEAKLALQLAGSVAGDVAMLTPDAANGNQGAHAAVGSEWPTYSVNEFVLKPCAVKAFVLFKPYGYGVNDLATLAQRSGAHCFLVRPPIGIEPAQGTLPPPPEFTSSYTVDELQAALPTLSLPASPSCAGNREDLFVYAAEVTALEENQRDVADVEKLRAFHNRHKGERCVIVGNGPSLNDMDLTLLANETCFAVNGIFYKTEEMGFKPKYYVVEDSSVMKENAEAIRSYDAPFKFFPTIYRSLHPASDNVSFFKMNRGFYEKSSSNYCVPRFSTDASQRVYCGQSVTFINLQLAYYMGFSEVALIGMDFSYVIPDSAIRDGDLITSTEDDPNHFNGAYFGKGKTWKDPKLDRVLQNYMMAKRVYEADGRRIINATLGGKLEAFDRVDYVELFRGSAST